MGVAPEGFARDKWCVFGQGTRRAAASSIQALIEQAKLAAIVPESL
jgi:hypothetical protein